MKETLELLPGTKAQKEAVKQLAEEHDIPIDGYLAWLAESQGPCNLLQKAARENNASLYKQTCVQEAASLPRHIMNAGTIYAQLTSSDLGMEDALKHLSEMCLPIAVYLLFAGEGYEASTLREKARAYCNMFPSAVQSLPEPYSTIGKALTEHDTT